MNRKIKISSNEGGVFTSNNNRISFNIPDGKYYDLSKSYLNLVSSIPVETANVGVVQPIVTIQNEAGNTGLLDYHRNSVLVKNVRFDNAMGNVENIQRSDILSAALVNYKEDDDAVVSHKYQDLVSVFGDSRSYDSIFMEKHTEGVVVSKNLLRQPVRIKCSDIMNFWNNRQYNSNKYGVGRLEVELNLDKVQINQYLEATYNKTGAAFDAASLVPWKQGGQNKNEFIQISNTSNKDHKDNKKLVIGAMGGTSPKVFNRLEDQCLFWVGQKLTIRATPTGTDANGDAPTPQGGENLANGVVRTIVAIDYNRGETNVGMPDHFEANNISITLDTALVTNVLDNSALLSNIECIGVDATFGAFQVDFAELVMEEVVSPDMDGADAPISYTTYKTEEFDTPVTQNFQRMFSVEPEAITLYITHPFGQTGGAQMISKQNGINNYRLRIDNKDTSGRQIELREDGSQTTDPLHIQKLMTALQNSGKRLNNLLDVNLNTNDLTTGPQNYNGRCVAIDQDNARLLIGQVLPRTQKEKQIQVNINSVAGRGVQRLCLFKECEKVI